MAFANKLTDLMQNLGVSQTKLHELTGIGKSSISQYLSGKNEPTKARKREIAIALGVKEDYFDEFSPVFEAEQNLGGNLPVKVAARLMRKSKQWVMQGLRDGVFPWGYAVKLTDWSYFISPAKFTEYTGIQIPLKDECNQ